MTSRLGFSAIAVLTLLTAACGKTPADSPSAPAEPASAPPAGSTATPATPLAGDAERGKAVFAQCRSCHTVDKDGADMTGPNLYGVIGRKAGSKADYKYSDALKAQGFTWDAARLDAWLTDPRADVPGTKMTFIGLSSGQDRADVIAYLRSVAAKP